MKTSRDWCALAAREFDHPSVILWRAVELRAIEPFIAGLAEPVLDLGCAEGKIASCLFDNAAIFGLDNSWDLLSARQKDATYKGRVLGDACRLPYKNGAFSSVFSNCVIEHIPDLDGLLREISRVLRPGGIFLFTAPGAGFGDNLFFSRIFKAMGLPFMASWYIKKRNALLNHVHCYNHGRWEGILKAGGFAVETHVYYMGPEATSLWDFMAFVMATAGRIPLLRKGVVFLNKKLIKVFKSYYNKEITHEKKVTVTEGDSHFFLQREKGSGVLIVARKTGQSAMNSQP